MPRSSLRSPVRHAVLALALAPAAGCSFHLGSFPCKAERTVVTTYALDPGGAVEITGFNGRIEVRGAGRDGIRVERTLISRASSDAEAREGLDLIREDVKATSEAFVLRLEDPRRNDLQLQAVIKAEVPAGARVILTGSNGAITLEEVRGAVRASTSNGRIFARDLGSGDVRLQTSNGAIRVERIAGRLEAHTSNGSIDVDGSSGGVKAESANARIEVDASAGAGGGIEVRTSNGAIHCVLPSSFQGDVEASTMNGRCHCDFPLEGGSATASRCQGRVGGGSTPVRLHTMNGTITIQRSGGPAPAESRPRTI